MKFIKKASVSLLMLPLILTVGCYNELRDLEFGDIEWSPELALPLFNTTFNIADLLEEADSTIGYFEENDRIVLFIEDDSLFSTRGSDYYSAPNKTFPTIPITLNTNEINEFNNSGSLISNGEVDFEYTSSLDSIAIIQAFSKLRLDENFPANGTITIGVKTKPNDGFSVPILNHSYSWNYDGFNQLTTDNHSDTFSNVNFVFSGSQPDNLLTLTYSLALSKVNGQNLIFNENSVDVELRFTNISFEYLVGDLITQEVSTGRNVIETDFFDALGDFGNATYSFAAPSFSLTYTNTLGVNARFNVGTFKYFSAGQENDINYDSEINLPKASFDGGTFTEVSFDEQIKEVLNAMPDSIEFGITGILDPENTADNFLKSDSRITIGYSLEIPLELSLGNLSFEEEVEISNVDPGDAKYAILYFTSQNELPLDVTLEAVALDADSTVLFQLFDGFILSAGSLGTAKQITNQIELRDDPNTARNELDFLNETTSIAIRAGISTTNNGTELVKISSKANVSFSVSVQTQYTIKLTN